MHEEAAAPYRVLLIEDNSADAELIQDYLSDETAFEIDVVPRLGDALALLGDRRFDVALLDLHLPDSHGVQALQLLHERAPALPVVVLTGTRGDQVALQAMSRGAQDYLIKGSIGPDVLVRSLRFAIERQRSELVMKAYHDSDRREEKLAGLGMVVAGVSHELNNPVAYLQGNAELALQLVDEALSSDSSEAAAAALQHVRKHLTDVLLGAKRLSEFTTALAAKSAATIDPARDANLDAIVDESIRLLQARLQHARTVREGTVGRSVPMHVEGVRIIVLQMLMNAVDATESVEGATIHVRTRATAQGAVLEVEDNGVGIPAEQRDHLFAPFFTTRLDRRGLGLHNSQAIARAHGGSIEYDGRKGTLFRLVLPWSPQEPTSATPSGQRSQE